MPLKYPLILVDHDDTIVNSTRTLHLPSFHHTVRTIKGDDSEWLNMTAEDWFGYNVDPGIGAFLGQVFHEHEREREHKMWHDYVKSAPPPAVIEGLGAVLHRYAELGGKIVVISHSEEFMIERAWLENDLPKPDLVFGWHPEEDKRKPHPFPAQEAMRKLGITDASRVIFADDLPPGLQCAKDAGVGVRIYAQWCTGGEASAKVTEAMQDVATHVITTVDAFGDLILTMEGEDEQGAGAP